ncbi:MAG TPA: hypothetical protein VJ837_02350 [Candidatus Paceibacterota bacterium]|nr:hypothetical protein [Candidatus Paceibacterota bacterium]
MPKQTEGVVVVGRHELTPTNQTVVAVAKRLRMSPGRLVARAKACLPTEVERGLYLAICEGRVEGSMMRPETLAKLLRAITGFRPLETRDLVSQPAGEHLRMNRVDVVAEFVTGVIQLCSGEVQGDDFTISFETAAALMLEYGTVEVVEEIIDSIVSELDRVREVLGYRGMGDAKAVSLAINLMVKGILPDCKLKGQPGPRYFMEYFEQGGKVGDILPEERD